MPTTGISLVREHTVAIRPPRALWVSFELGRPFGAPHDQGLQMRVLRAALALLERSDGPVILDDFPEDAPSASPEELEGMVCPVPLPRPATASQRRHADAVRAEMAALAPWYALASQRNGGTTVGVSGLGIADVITYLDALQTGSTPPPAPGLSPAQTLRFATEDLRTWYLEAASARPGGGAGPAVMAEWFWGETAAGALLLVLQPVCAASPDQAVRGVAASTMIPRTQQHRLKPALAP